MGDKTMQPNKGEVKQASEHEEAHGDRGRADGLKTSDGATPEKKDQHRQADQASGRDKH